MCGWVCIGVCVYICVCVWGGGLVDVYVGVCLRLGVWGPFH